MTQVYRRARFGRAVVVVSGLPRSGTSMTMQMLRTGGLEVVTDGVRQASEDNPKGYFEDERVKVLYQDGDKSWLRAARGKAIKIISFLLKDLPPDNNYQVLFMQRDLSEVLASQAKMLSRREMDNETDDEKMLELWKDHLWRVKYLMKHSSHLEFIELPYKAVIQNPRSEAERMKEFLRCDLDVDKMAGAVDSRLYRNRSQR